MLSIAYVVLLFQGQLQFYWNFDTNEQFEVLNVAAGAQIERVCIRQGLTNASQTSVIAPDSLILKPSILLGFGPRNQKNTKWGIRYDVDEDLRGIPVNRFRSCFYVEDIKATVNATYYVSDVNKFQAYLPANQSIVLRIDVQIKQTTGKTDAYIYNVFRYMPNPPRGEERQALDTPEGVYCPDRTPTLPLPENLPERFSWNFESFTAELNRSIVSLHRLTDLEYQFTRSDFWIADPSGSPRWQHFTEIHDFAVGLRYQYDPSTRLCAVSNITAQGLDAVLVDGQSNLLQMANPQHAFLLDDADYQYAGEKPCRDRVMCHVWIGRKVMPDKSVEQREWYWATNINGEALPQPRPAKLVLKKLVM